VLSPPLTFALSQDQTLQLNLHNLAAVLTTEVLLDARNSSQFSGFSIPAEAVIENLLSRIRVAIQLSETDASPFQPCGSFRGVAF
jgi:hypothetical protein